VGISPVLKRNFTLIKKRKEQVMSNIKNNLTMKTAKPYVLWVIFAAWMLAIFAVMILLEYKM